MHDSDVSGDDVGADLPIFYRLAKHPYTAGQLLAIDAATVILLAVVCEFLLPRMAPRVEGRMWTIVGWTGYALSGALTLGRRRFPRTTLVCLFLITSVAESLRAAGPTPFYLVLALYSVVAMLTRRVALVVVGVVAAGVIGSSIAAGGGGLAVVSGIIGGLALMSVGWLAGENTRVSRVYRARQAERAIEQAAAVEAERADQVRRAVADERVEIARELHDIVAHAMSVIAVRSGVARMVIDTQPEQAREALTIIETTTRRSLQEMRLLVGVLRDADEHSAEMGPAPSMADIDRLVAETGAAGVAVDVEIDGKPGPLPTAASLSAYRIIQEALTNVVRHAGPTHARLRLRFRPDEIDIEVIDDGPEPAARPNPVLARQGAGHGLIGMRERAALFGGSLEVGPWGRGFRVRVDLHTENLQSADPNGTDPSSVDLSAIGRTGERRPEASPPAGDPPRGDPARVAR